LATLEQRITKSNQEFYLLKLRAQSLADSFMAMFEAEKSERSKKIIKKIFQHYPDLTSYGDLTMLHNLSFLKEIDMHREEKDFTDYDMQIRRISAKLLSVDPDNPYANSYLASYYQKKGNIDSTQFYYNKIIRAKNFARNWYTTQAENWVNQKMINSN
jgi:hypothetical protein